MTEQDSAPPQQPLAPDAAVPGPVAPASPRFEAPDTGPWAPADDGDAGRSLPDAGTADVGAADASGPPLPAPDAAVRVEAGTPEDAGRPHEGPRCPTSASCEAGSCLFFDGFEEGPDDWVLDQLWTENRAAFEGERSMLGYWSNHTVGCGVTAPLHSTVEISLVGVKSATLSFTHSGDVCSFDSLWLVVSTDQGGSWERGQQLEDAIQTWAIQEVDLTPWLGQPSLRLGFEFENICGDSCGVRWLLDNVAVCAER